jgi:predicted transcriptional regulator YheO
VDAVLTMLRPVVEAIGRTVGSHCEVVLHDLRVPERSIVAISNGAVTGRHVGGPVVGGPSKDVALRLLDSAVKDSTLSVGYRTQTRDGRELRSTSLVLRTPGGKPVIALCLNVDLSAFTMVRALLEEIAKPAPMSADAPEETQLDVGEVIPQMIQEALAEVGKPPKFMDREDRLRTVGLMHERGLFLIRGGVERAAAALGISKFTLYGYLKEVRFTAGRPT